MFYEPHHTQYDLSFRIGDIPVRIHPMYWLLLLILGGSAPGPTELLLWFIVVTVSVLAHELGHALVMRYFGMHPRIVLYSFGGMTIPDRLYHLRWFENVFVSFSGPFAGFLLLGMVIILCLLGGQTQVLSYVPYVIGLDSQIAQIGNATTSLFVLLMIQVNLFWGFLNLLPIYPLDGGQICREISVFLVPDHGLLRSLRISLVTAIILTVWAFYGSHFFIAIMFAWMAFSNYQIIQRLSQPRWH